MATPEPTISVVYRRLCSTGLPNDVIIQVGEMAFHLHKFPLLSRSRVLENHISELSDGDDKKGDDDKKSVLQLNDLPGGEKTFLLVSKFCYGVKIELTALNVVSLRCAADYLQMTEDYGDGNLIMQTETFLDEVFGNWVDTIKALETCEEVLPNAEELHIVSRCINSLAMKACTDPSLFSWPVSGSSGSQSPVGTVFWNGIHTASKPHSLSEDWWYEDVSSLRLPLYKRLIQAVGSRGMKPERIAGSLMFYAKKYLPLNGRQSSLQNGTHAAPGPTLSASSQTDQRTLLEEIVELLPDQKGITPTKLLLRLLRTSMILHASPSCRENLEKRVGSQLDQAVMDDLLIPNMGYSVETLYDIDCVQRILDHFMLVDEDAIESASNCLDDEGQMMGGSHKLTPLTMVANLVDNYLAEVAPDVNLKLMKFRSLAAVIPDYARQNEDGIYRAIDIYLKAHPWLMDSEREQLCRLMNFQKLSLEAITHAAQNERLPLRVIVQVLFFEQLQLRTSVASWLYVTDNLESSQNPSGNLAPNRNDRAIQLGCADNRIVAVDDIRERVTELENECLSMKQEMEKLVKTKRSWNSLCKMLGLRLKSKSCDPKASKMHCNAKVSPPSTPPLLNGKQHQDNGQLVD
ncbi:unnamed protein product [Ilex paraguariensis]|uniref:Phototropic-responsive NPH3 family protein n=1 Tax=Ilex paraguariensis TaxID=185542 RepID=A0ABC8TA59_9AQUA